MPISAKYIKNKVSEIIYAVSEDTIADGNYDYQTSEDGPRNVIVDALSFVDGNGDYVSPSAGTVTIQFCSQFGLFENVANGSFDAANARDPARAKPSGIGRVEVIRIILAGVSGGGATGFRAAITQFQ